MTTELTKSEIEYVDGMVQTIVGSLVARDQTLNPDYFRAIAQTAYRSALVLLDVKKDYVVEKEVVEIDLGQLDIRIEPEPMEIEVKEKPAKKAKKKTKAKGKPGRPKKKKSPAVKVEPLGAVVETSA